MSQALSDVGMLVEFLADWPHDDEDGDEGDDDTDFDDDPYRDCEECGARPQEPHSDDCSLSDEDDELDGDPSD